SYLARSPFVATGFGPHVRPDHAGNRRRTDDPRHRGPAPGRPRVNGIAQRPTHGGPAWATAWPWRTSSAWRLPNRQARDRSDSDRLRQPWAREVARQQSGARVILDRSPPPVRAGRPTHSG